MRSCTKCKRDDLTDDDFHPSNRRKNGQCRKCVNAATAARHEQLRAAGLCLDCRNPTQAAGSICEICTERRRQWYYDRYHSQQLAYSKDRRVRLKLAALGAYGGAICKCCGERHLEFLTIDHLNNDGAEHRRQLGTKGTKFYEWLRNNGYPPGFQVLCLNCNFAKGHGGCPHERERLAA